MNTFSFFKNQTNKKTHPFYLGVAFTVLTFCCMNCCQSAILSLAFRVWVEPTFSEVDMYVERAILLHALQKFQSTENIVKETSHITVTLI